MELTKVFSQFNFIAGEVFQWSPATHTITFIKKQMSGSTGQLSLLHEISHGLLSHNKFQSDLELIRMEVAAWQKTKLLATELSIDYDEEGIERCLDSYRDWLDARSRCPDCDQTGLQQNNQSYRCIACGEKWRVPVEQTCSIKRFRLSN